MIRLPSESGPLDNPVIDVMGQEPTCRLSATPQSTRRGTGTA